MSNLPAIPFSYGRQSVSAEDIEAVVSAMKGDWLTQGPYVSRFEEAVSHYVGAEFAVAFSSGTAALHGAVHAAGIGPGHQVVTSPLTFVASANAARYVGAEPILVDVDPETYNLDLEKVPTGVDAAIVVHFAGLPVDLRPSRWRARPRVVIEDAAHALGAQTPYGPVGNCAFSDMTCFSFHPVKPITTGEGGMVTTNDPGLAERLRAFRNHGIHRGEGEPHWKYEVRSLGFNYRMTDIQAALGISQLKKLDEFIQRRNELASVYDNRLIDISGIGTPPKAAEGFRHGYHIYPITLRSRDKILFGLRDRGVNCQIHYIPVHHHPDFSDITIAKPGLDVCDSLARQIVSIPLFPDITENQQETVISILESLLAES